MDIIVDGLAHLNYTSPNFTVLPDTVGTGGESHYQVGQIRPNSQVRESNTFGVLKMTLSPDSYTWEFIPIAGSSFRDSGTGTCH